MDLLDAIERGEPALLGSRLPLGRAASLLCHRGAGWSGRAFARVHSADRCGIYLAQHGGQHRAHAPSKCGLRSAWPVKKGGLGRCFCHEESVCGQHDDEHAITTASGGGSIETNVGHSQSDVYVRSYRKLKAVPWIFTAKKLFFSLLASGETFMLAKSSYPNE